MATDPAVTGLDIAALEEPYQPPIAATGALTAGSDTGVTAPSGGSSWAATAQYGSSRERLG